MGQGVEETEKAMKTKLRPDQMPLLRTLPMADDDSTRFFRLEEEYRLPFRGGFLVCPVNFVTDFASIPSFFQRIYSPTGYLLIAALFHDYAYANAYYLWQPFVEFPDEVFKTTVDQSEADNLFREIGWVYYPEHKKKTWVAYKALRIGGFVAWNEHREKAKEAKFI